MDRKNSGTRAAVKAARPTQTSIFEQMMENCPLNFMRADTDMVIRYMNAASRPR